MFPQTVSAFPLSLGTEHDTPDPKLPSELPSAKILFTCCSNDFTTDLIFSNSAERLSTVKDSDAVDAKRNGVKKEAIFRTGQTI